MCHSFGSMDQRVWSGAALMHHSSFSVAYSGLWHALQFSIFIHSTVHSSALHVAETEKKHKKLKDGAMYAHLFGFQSSIQHPSSISGILHWCNRIRYCSHLWCFNFVLTWSWRISSDDTRWWYGEYVGLNVVNMCGLVKFFTSCSSPVNIITGDLQLISECNSTMLTSCTQ